MNSVLPADRSLIFIISGPAGVGKTTLCQHLKKNLADRIENAITSTTRPTRCGEIHGKDYYFLSIDDFKKAIGNDVFCEYSIVHGHHYYGLTLDEVRRHFNSGKDILLNMDVQGAMKLHRLSLTREDHFLRNRVVSIFLFPPSIEDLRKRMYRRKTDAGEEIERRLQSATSELQSAPYYDYLLPAITPQQTLKSMLHIYYAEKLRTHR